MKAKKIISILLTLCMLIGLLASCAGEAGGGDADTNNDPAQGEGGEAAAPEESQGGEAAVPEESRRGGVLNLAWKGNGSDNLDPFYSTGWLTYIWSQNVFETAISRDAEGNYVPNVCNFEVSEDRLTLKLWVRDGLTFHNGDPVTIDDVVYSLLIHMRGSTNNLDTYFIEYVDSYEVEDGVATFHFNAYNANTLYYLSGYATFATIMPKSIIEKYETDEDNIFITDLNDLIGTGPYKLNVKDTEPGRLVALERYEGYLPVEGDYSGLGGPKRAYMDKINVYFNSEENSIAMSLMNGNYDAAQISGDFTQLLEGTDLKSTTDLGNNISYIAFTADEARPVADVNLRKAIASALDYKSVLQVAVGEGFYTLDNCPMVQGSYYTTAFSDVDYFGDANIELAKDYLSKSSYNGETIIIASKSSDRTGIIIKSLLEAAGISADIDYIDDSAFNAYIVNPDNPYDMLYLSSAKCDTVPSSMVTNLRVRFWNDPDAKELFSIIGSSVAGSQESLEAWKTMYTKWVADAHILPLGATQGMIYHDKDLVINSEGNWRYFFNSYWLNPSEHTD